MAKKLNMKCVTLFSTTSIKIEETEKAIKTCEHYAEFADTILIKNQTLKNTVDYSQFIINKLPYIISTSYVLVIQWDGFIINPNAWTPEFLEYDYIGAPWPPFNHICGNGGFSLRSKKFLAAQKKLIPNIDYQEILRAGVRKDLPEDFILAFYYRKYFEDCGCKFAPTELGYRFSIEVGDYNKNNIPFGFHGIHHPELFKYHD